MYSLAHHVPDPYVWEDDNDDISDWEPGPEAMTPGEHISRWSDLRTRIAFKLGTHSVFHHVYDPADPTDREVVDSELPAILAEIYLDLKEGLMLYARSSDEERAQALWDWRFGLAHWGGHAAEALLPIHRLLHSHYDEDDEVFDI